MLILILWDFDLFIKFWNSKFNPQLCNKDTYEAQFRVFCDATQLYRNYPVT